MKHSAKIFVASVAIAGSLFLPGCNRTGEEAHSPLLDAIVIAEQQPGTGTNYPVKPGGYVDYQGTLQITPDNAKIASLVAGGRSSDPDSFSHAVEGLAKIKAIVATFTELNTLYARIAVVMPPQADPANAGEVAALNQLRAMKEVAIITAIIDLIDWKIRRAQPDMTKAELAVEREKLNKGLVTMPTPEQPKLTYNVDAAMRFLQEMTAAVAADTRQATGTATLEITAYRHAAGTPAGQRAPIAVPPYAEVKGQDPLIPVPRFALPDDPKTAEKIKADEALYNELVPILNELTDSAKRTAPNSRTRELLDQIRILLEQSRLKTMLIELRDELRAILAGFDDPAVGEIKTAAGKLTDELGAAAAILEKLRDSRISSESFEAIRKLLAHSEAIKYDTAKLTKLVTDFVPSGTAQELQKKFATAIKDKVAKHMTTSAPALLDLIAKAQAAIAARIDQGLAGLPELELITHPQDVGALPIGHLDLDGHLNPGDSLLVEVTLHKSGKVQETQPYKYGVRKKGFSAESDAVILFIGRHNQENGGSETTFAPAVVVNGHYRPINDDGDFWEYVYPSIGVSFATIPTDNKVGVGVGGHISFLKDFIQVGGGYNISVDSSPGYFYVGLGLIAGFNLFAGK